MKHSKKIVVSIAALMMTLSSKADNLPGRTRNLNILRHNKHLWFQLSSSEEGSHNILRDLACNCDNPDFELHILSSMRPFALLNKLGDFETDEELEEFLMNPKPSLVHLAYM